MTYAFRPDLSEIVLEEELRQLAAELSEAAWRGPAYDQFLADPGSFAPSMRTHLEAVEAAYAETHVCPQELTQEAAVAHRLLLDGLDAWHTALETGLVEWAEEGSRLLATLQLYSRRLELER